MLGLNKIRSWLPFGKAAHEDFVYRTENGISQLIQYLAKQRLKNQGGVQYVNDFLLAGRPDQFAEQAFGARFHTKDIPTNEGPGIQKGDFNISESLYTWMGVPRVGVNAEGKPYDISDLVLPYYFDGKLPNGGDVYTVGYRHFKAENAKEMIRQSASRGIKIGTTLGLGVFAFSASVSLLPMAYAIGMPTWDLGLWVLDLPLGAMLHATTASGAIYVVDAVSKLLELICGGAGTLVTCATLGAAVFAASASASTMLTLNRTLGVYKEKLTAHLAVPTKDSLLIWKNTMNERAINLRVYAGAVIEAITRRAGLPLIEAGIATGLLRSRGYNTAPVKGQILCWDAESIRSHVIFFGKTGVGKTLRGIRRMFRNALKVDWGADHKFGAIIFDGKGELCFDLRDELMKHAPHRLKDFYLVGTEDGAFGIDLLSGMDPVEVSDNFLLIAGQINGTGGSDGTKWINGAAGAIKMGAFLAQFLESQASRPSSIWGSRKYKPYSLLGLLAITTIDSLNIGISDEILKAVEGGANIDSDTVEAAKFFTETWKAYAPETRSSYVSNITDTLGKLSGTKRLAERFASGKMDDVMMTDVDQAFNGKIIGIGISEIEDGEAGLIIANWIKSRAYLLAQRRVTKSAKAREMLGRIKDCAENYDAVWARFIELSRLNRRLQVTGELLAKARGGGVGADQFKANAEAEFVIAKSIFEELFPKHREVTVSDVRIMESLRKDDSEGIEIRVQGFTDYVKSVANPGVGNEGFAKAELERLEWEAVMTKKSSCLCLIDEYQNFVTVGGGGKADSSFLNVARATGLFVVAATQSIHALNAKIGHDATANILNNFVSKIFFQTGDKTTYDYCIALAGEGFQSRTYSRNFFANFSQVLETVRDEWIPTPVVKAWDAIWPNLKLSVDDSYGAMNRQIEEIDVGSRNSVNWGVGEDENEQSNLRRNVLDKQDAQEREIKDGAVAPYLTVKDLSDMSGGHAFCIIDRAGWERKDMVYFGI